MLASNKKKTYSTEIPSYQSNDNNEQTAKFGLNQEEEYQNSEFSKQQITVKQQVIEQP